MSRRERLGPLLADMTRSAKESGRSLDRATVHLEEARGRTTTPDLTAPWWKDAELTETEQRRAERNR